MGENMENMKWKLEIFVFILEKFTDDHLVEFSSYYLSTLTDNSCRDILTERNRSNNLQCALYAGVAFAACFVVTVVTLKYFQ